MPAPLWGLIIKSFLTVLTLLRELSPKVKPAACPDWIADGRVSVVPVRGNSACLVRCSGFGEEPWFALKASSEWAPFVGPTKRVGTVISIAKTGWQRTPASDVYSTLSTQVELADGGHEQLPRSVA